MMAEHAIHHINVVPNVELSTVINSSRFIKTKDFGTLMGTMFFHKGNYFAFCPMEISVLVISLEYPESEGDIIHEFFMDNEELVEMEYFEMFEEDELPQGKLEDIYKYILIPHLEENGIII